MKDGSHSISMTSTVSGLCDTHIAASRQRSVGGFSSAQYGRLLVSAMWAACWTWSLWHCRTRKSCRESDSLKIRCKLCVSRKTWCLVTAACHLNIIMSIAVSTNWAPRNASSTISMGTDNSGNPHQRSSEVDLKKSNTAQYIKVSC